MSTPEAQDLMDPREVLHDLPASHNIMPVFYFLDSHLSGLFLITGVSQTIRHEHLDYQH